jgi:hypothetical protein
MYYILLASLLTEVAQYLVIIFPAFQWQFQLRYNEVLALMPQLYASVCYTINAMYIQQITEVSLPSVQISAGICK